MVLMTKVDEAVSALMIEVQKDTIEKLKEFISEKNQMTEEILAAFKEYEEKISKDDPKSHVKKGAKAAKGTKAAKAGKASTSKATKNDTEDKPKRPPSAYNIFLREKIAELKEQGHEGNLMKLAIEAWNANKVSGDEVKKPTTTTKKVVAAAVVESEPESEPESETDSETD